MTGLRDSSLVKESLMLEGLKQVGQHLGLQSDAQYANSGPSVGLGLTVFLLLGWLGLPEEFCPKEPFSKTNDLFDTMFFFSSDEFEQPEHNWCLNFTSVVLPKSFEADKKKRKRKKVLIDYSMQ